MTLFHRNDTQIFVVVPSTKITIVRRTLTVADSIEGMMTNHKLDAPQQAILESFHSARKALISRSPGVHVPRSIILSGPPGVGKTHAVRMAVEVYREETNGHIRFESLRGSECVGDSGGIASSLDFLEKTFSNCVESRGQYGQDGSFISVVFIDEFDALVSIPEFAAKLSHLLDRISNPSHGTTTGGNTDSAWKSILLLAATNRVECIPDYLRRPGRFDREIVVSPPNATQRLAMLKKFIYIANPTCSISDEELMQIAEACVGYVAADLKALIDHALCVALESSSYLISQIEGMPCITALGLMAAMKEVGASVRIRGFGH